MRLLASRAGDGEVLPRARAKAFGWLIGTGTLKVNAICSMIVTLLSALSATNQPRDHRDA